MAIEHIRFQNCDACGRRFRDSGRQVSYAKVLCEECQEKEKQRDPEEEPVPEIEEEHSPEDLDIGSLDDLSAGEDAGEGGMGPTLEEIAARTPRRHRRRRSQTKTANRLSWPLYAGCLLLVIGIGLAGLWRARIKGRQLAEQGAEDSPFGGVPVLPVPDLPDYEKARELAGRFVREGEVEEVMGMIRPWPGMKKAVGEFLAENPPVDGAAEMLSDMPPVIQTGIVYQRIVYQSFGLLLPDGTGRLVQVVETSDGPKVDFKAYVEWCSVPPDELLAGKVEQADEVRAILRPSTYYNFEFASSEQFLAFSATLAGQSEQLTVYVPREGDAVEPLARAVQQIGMHPATFSLQSVGESYQRQQFLLSELKAIGFVVPEERTKE